MTRYEGRARASETISCRSRQLANHAGRVVGLEHGHCLGGQPSLLGCEVRHKVAPRRVMLPHVVVVDALLDQLAGSDQSVDRRDRGVGLGEEPAAPDVADDSAVDLDDGIGADHLQIKNEA